MKREILFRGKRIDNGEWVYGYFYEECGATYIIEDRQKETMLNRNTPNVIIPETIGQFTGFTDKKGVKIFEGDIGVRYLDKGMSYTDGKTWRDYWLIEWYKGGFITTISADYSIYLKKMIVVSSKPNEFSKRFDEIEIIGNIHDNPELLNG